MSLRPKGDVRIRLDQILRPRLKFLGRDETPTDDRSLTEYGLDSLGALELLFEIEQAFGIHFPDESLLRNILHSRGSLEQTIVELMNT